MFSRFIVAFVSVFPAVILASVATYFSSTIPFVTSIVKLSIILLYPAGASVSVICIISALSVLVISTCPKSNIPLAFVSPVCASLSPGNV